MTPADERILQLLARWQKSLELHLRYAKLPDDQYRQLQDWPAHERPSPWIVDLASQRLAALQRIVQARLSAGDPSLSEALELMAFLANLVGSEHLQRRIPLAEDQGTQDTAGSGPRRAAKVSSKSTAPQPARAASEPPPVGEEGVIADAVRLTAWGKAWHELPEAIARTAGRPDAAAVRRVLKGQRKNIEQQAANLPAGT